VAGKFSDDLKPGTLASIFTSKLGEKAENNDSAYVPDLPGCVATGETVAAVEREMQEAIGFHLDGMRDDGITPPEPTSVVDYVDA